MMAAMRAKQEEIARARRIAPSYNEPYLLEINNGGTGYEGLEKSRREDEVLQKNHAEI